MSKSHVETEFRNLMYKVDVQNKCIKVMCCNYMANQWLKTEQ